MNAQELRARLLDYLAEHEKECLGGCRERPNIIAWLAHAVGIRADAISEVTELLRDYEAHCVDCQHMRN